jgi:hypothetical protein
MTKYDLINKFTEELKQQYGKQYYSEITVARAVEVLEAIIPDNVKPNTGKTI